MSRPKGPDGTGRDARNKKKKALETDKYKEEIERLAAGGGTAGERQESYGRCQERTYTCIKVNSFIRIFFYEKRRNKRGK